MKILVTDRESIELGFLVKSTYVVISVSDPGVRKAKIRRVTALKDVLYLSFNDSGPVDNFQLPEEIKLMTEKQARSVWQFVDRYRNEVGAIVVHCHQGMSRSPAIAAAIARYLGLDEKRFWAEHQPNEFIYQLMLDNMPRVG